MAAAVSVVAAVATLLIPFVLGRVLDGVLRGGIERRHRTRPRGVRHPRRHRPRRPAGGVPPGGGRGRRGGGHAAAADVGRVLPAAVALLPGVRSGGHRPRGDDRRGCRGADGADRRPGRLHQPGDGGAGLRSPRRLRPAAGGDRGAVPAGAGGRPPPRPQHADRGQGHRRRPAGDGRFRRRAHELRRPGDVAGLRDRRPRRRGAGRAVGRRARPRRGPGPEGGRSERRARSGRPRDPRRDAGCRHVARGPGRGQPGPAHHGAPAGAAARRAHPGSRRVALCPRPGSGRPLEGHGDPAARRHPTGSAAPAARSGGRSRCRGPAGGGVIPVPGQRGGRDPGPARAGGCRPGHERRRARSRPRDPPGRDGRAGRAVGRRQDDGRPPGRRPVHPDRRTGHVLRPRHGRAAGPPEAGLRRPGPLPLPRHPAGQRGHRGLGTVGAGADQGVHRRRRPPLRHALRQRLQHARGGAGPAPLGRRAPACGPGPRPL